MRTGFVIAAMVFTFVAGCFVATEDDPKYFGAALAGLLAGISATMAVMV